MRKKREEWTKGKNKIKARGRKNKEEEESTKIRDVQTPFLF
jgi:hypothetical protein